MLYFNGCAKKTKRQSGHNLLCPLQQSIVIQYLKTITMDGLLSIITARTPFHEKQECNKRKICQNREGSLMKKQV